MKLIIAFLLLGATAFSQNVAVLTHGAANTEEFKAGCPSNWPSTVVDLGPSTNLPPTLQATNGWRLLTAVALADMKATNAAAKDAFNEKWMAKNGPGKVWTSLEFLKYVESVSPGAWDRLDDAIANPVLPAYIKAQLRMARRSVQTAQDVEQRHPDTVAFITSASLLGILTPAQAETILGTTP